MIAHTINHDTINQCVGGECIVKSIIHPHVGNLGTLDLGMNGLLFLVITEYE